MAGLSAAWELSRPELRHEVAQVTVYQRGWRLGGKGASSRGAHGRIEEHGLHVWLGYYDNAFRLVREAYEELDRGRRDPACPVRTWRDAFVPADHVGVAEEGPAGWEAWVATFGRNDLVPGDPAAATGAGPLGLAAFARRAVRLLADLVASLGPAPGPPVAPGVYLTASPRPPGGRAGRGGLGGLGDARELGAVLGRAEVAALAAALTGLDALDRAGLAAGPLRAVAAEQLGALRAQLRARVRTDPAGRRLVAVADLVLTCLTGMVRDGLTTPERLPTIDDQDFRAWLAGHGAAAETLRSPLLAGMYDLVFAYEDGDPDRPAFAAGLGLFLAGKMFLEYKGSLFWKMAAGMGDVVIAPLYQALRARGVRFELFTQVEALRLAPGPARRLAAVEITRQARPRAGAAAYEPLVRVRGLPCFPAGPDGDQLAGPVPSGTERHDARRPTDDADTLVVGRDVDDVVLATSLGAVPAVAADLVATSGRWRRLVAEVATVGTQAAQLWLDRTEAELGWPHPPVTLSGWAPPFDTYASMGHLLAMEDWPAGAAPRDLVYLCSARPEAAPADEASLRRAVGRLLDERVGDLWPRARAGGVARGVLHGGLDGQFVTAATDPSDRYVQSLPGSGRHRLRADGSGVAGLALAGDWTSCGLDAGCIEAAVLSGLRAANAVLGRPPGHGVLGHWYPLAPPDAGEDAGAAGAATGAASAGAGR